MVPQESPVAHLVELGNAHAVGIGLRLLGHDVHRHLGEIEVGADAGSGGDARLAKHFADHLHRHLMGRETVEAQIGSDVHEDLIDGIGMDVLGRHMAQVDAVDLLTHLHIARHARRRHDIVQLEIRAGLQLGVVGRRACEATCGHTATALLVDLPDALHNLEEAGTSADAVLLQRRSDGQADGLLRAAQIGHDEVGGERIEPAVHTLHRGVERLKVDGDISSLLLLHSGRLLSVQYLTFSRHQVEAKALTVVEATLSALEGDGEDDDLGIGEVGVHPAIAHIEIGGLLRAFYREHGGSLRSEGDGVADVLQRRPTRGEAVGMGYHALVGAPARTSRREHEVAPVHTHDGRGLAALAGKELRVLRDGKQVVGEAEEAQVLILLSGGDEPGRAVVIGEDVAVAALDAQWASAPYLTVGALHAVGHKAGGLGGAVVVRLPMTPDDVFARLLRVKQLGTLDHAAASELGVGDTVFDDFTEESPMN